MCIVKSSACNTLRHWFMPIYSPLLFSCIVSFVQEHLACLWLLGRGCDASLWRVLQDRKSFSAKRTPSESSSITEPCLSKLTIIKTVFDTSKIVFPAPATSMRGRAVARERFFFWAQFSRELARLYEYSYRPYAVCLLPNFVLCCINRRLVQCGIE